MSRSITANVDDSYKPVIRSGIVVCKTTDITEDMKPSSVRIHTFVSMSHILAVLSYETVIKYCRPSQMKKSRQVTWRECPERVELGSRESRLQSFTVLSFEALAKMFVSFGLNVG